MQVCFAALSKGHRCAGAATWQFTASFWLITTLVACGCQTIAYEHQSQLADAASVAEKTSDDANMTSKGYFVAVSADASNQEFHKFYQQLYHVIDVYNRRQKRDKKSLKAYLIEQKESGYAALKVNDDEIECDKQKCLIKLSSRVISGPASLARHLGEALAQLVETQPARSVAKSKVQSRRSYVVGNPESIHIICDSIATAMHPDYRCQFNLDQALYVATASTTTMGDAGRGKLESCDMAPGTVRDAEEAKDQLDSAGLLPLTLAPSPDAKVVGYFRYAHVAEKVEFFDIYLCGDMSQDHFQMEGEARQPQTWLEQRSLQIPALDRGSLSTVGLNLETKLVESSAAELLIEVRFRLVDQNDQSAVLTGSDKFYLHLNKAWLR